MPYTRDGLFAPQDFLDASYEEIRAVCNGCGAADAKFDFVPDTIYLLKIKPCCDIHDWMYHKGKTLQDRWEADATFFQNLVRLITSNTRFRWLRVLRIYRAAGYFVAVREMGEPAFWSGKTVTGVLTTPSTCKSKRK